MTAKERDVIMALAYSYGDDGKGTPARDQAYADAMHGVAHQYPDAFPHLDPQLSVITRSRFFNGSEH